jgi:hypothetical protein
VPVSWDFVIPLVTARAHPHPLVTVALRTQRGRILQGWLQTAVLARALRDRADLLPGRLLGRTHALGDEAADADGAPGRRDNASVRRERLADARGGGWSNSAGWGGTEQADQQRHRQ